MVGFNILDPKKKYIYQPKFHVIIFDLVERYIIACQRHVSCCTRSSCVSVHVVKIDITKLFSLDVGCTEKQKKKTKNLFSLYVGKAKKINCVYILTLKRVRGIFAQLEVCLNIFKNLLKIQKQKKKWRNGEMKWSY